MNNTWIYSGILHDETHTNTWLVSSSSITDITQLQRLSALAKLTHIETDRTESRESCVLPLRGRRKGNTVVDILNKNIGEYDELSQRKERE